MTHPTSITVALVQLECNDRESESDRILRGVDLANEAAGDVDIVVLPELWHAGAFHLEAIAETDPETAPHLVSELRKVAVRHGTWIHTGSYVEVVDGKRFNTSAVIDPDGHITATYRKIHLYGFGDGEAKVMTAGTDVVLTPTALGSTGLSTCYDLRFPELYRQQVSQGAQGFIVTSGWPDSRIEHWRTLLRARAIENQAFVLACNAVGRHAGVSMGGHSAVVAPSGEVIAEGSAVREEVVTAAIDISTVAHYRATFPWLKDRTV